jgi:hypothetical protein
MLDPQHLLGGTFVLVLHKSSMNRKFDAADNRERGASPGVQDPCLARAHVSVGLGLSLENVLRGRTLGVGEEPAGLVYRWPPVSTPLEWDLSVAYTAVTGRRVFGGPHRLLILAARLHGPDTIPLLGKLYREGGVDDLLRRLIAYPPRLDPHPDYIVAPAVPPQAEPQGPAAPSPAAPIRMASESLADRVSRGVRPRPPEANHRTSSGLTPIAAIVRRPAEDRLTPDLEPEPTASGTGQRTLSAAVGRTSVAPVLAPPTRPTP